MEAPPIATNPRERVWNPFHDKGFIEIKFAFDYFTTHEKTPNSSDACAETALTTLRFRDQDPKKTKECFVCL